MDKRSKFFLFVIINFSLDNLLVLLGENWYQWRIQGRGQGGPTPPLFLDQTEARRAEKNFLRPGPPLSESLDPPLDIGHFWDLKG